MFLSKTNTSKIFFHKKLHNLYYIIDITKLFNGRKRNFRDQQKEQWQGNSKKVTKESQDSYSVDDGDIFNQGICGLGYAIFNCSKNLETRITEIFKVSTTANENQL